jgi:hypothetical protein
MNTERTLIYIHALNRIRNHDASARQANTFFVTVIGYLIRSPLIRVEVVYKMNNELCMLRGTNTSVPYMEIIMYSLFAFLLCTNYLKYTFCASHFKINILK